MVSLKKYLSALKQLHVCSVHLDVAGYTFYNWYHDLFTNPVKDLILCIKTVPLTTSITDH